jgi:hypothetical protein
MKIKRIKMQILAILGISITLLSSCVAQKYLQISDGSKADGTLTLVYEYGIFEKPVVHWDEAKQSALIKCQSWGYKGAEFFDVGTRQCINQDNQGNCNIWRVTFKCQCTEK